MKTNHVTTICAVSRFFRILLSVCICVVASLIISSLLWHNGEGHYTHRAASPLFVLFFLWPFVVGFVIVMSSLFFLLDRDALRNGRIAPKQLALLVLVLALGTLAGFFNLLLGAFPLFLLFYWLMTGRVSGRPGWSISGFWHTKWDEKLYLVIMIAIFAQPVGSIASRTFHSMLPFEPGTPAFQVKYERQMNSSIVRASHSFPDAQSCLVSGANAGLHEDLAQMDWDQIDNGSEAKVCMFRLLHGWGGVGEAAGWLEAQGFRVGENFSSTTPYVERDGTLRVTGGWSIKNNGPRYPTTGVLRRILSAMPYGMGVNATYSSDGQELLYLETTFSTL